MFNDNYDLDTDSSSSDPSSSTSSSQESPGLDDGKRPDLDSCQLLSPKCDPYQHFGNDHVDTDQSRNLKSELEASSIVANDPKSNGVNIGGHRSSYVTFHKSNHFESDDPAQCQFSLEGIRVLSPHDFIIYPHGRVQLVQKEAIYVVESVRQKVYESYGIDIVSFFQIRVEWPDKLLTQVPLHRDSVDPSRHLCCFVPTMPGQYVLSVVLTRPNGLSKMLGPPRLCVEVGSSTDVFVCRNYSLQMNVGQVDFGCGGSYKKFWGVQVHRKTNLIYVTDRESHLISVLDSSGKVVNVIGQGQSRDQLYRPTGVALSDDRLFVSDKDNHRICVFNLDGSKTYPSIGQKGHTDGNFQYPWGLAVSPRGNLLAVCDSRNYRIQIFDTATGAFLRKFTVFEKRPFDYKKEFNYPRGVTFDSHGNNLYVTDFNLNAVFKLDVGLTTKTTYVQPGRLNRPQGLTMDHAGNILVCDSKNKCVRVVDPDGNCQWNMFVQGRLQEPTDVAVLNDGRMVIVDSAGQVFIR